MIHVVKPPRKYSVCRRNNNLHQMERVQDTADRGPTKRCSGCGCFKFQYCKRCAELRHQTGCSHKLCDSKRRLASIALEFVTICGLQQYFNRCLSQQKPEGCCTKSGSSVAQAAQRKIRRAPVVGLGSVEGKMWPGASFPRYAQESPSLHGSSRFLVSNRFKIMSSFDNPNSESPHPNLPLLANRTTLS